MVYRFLKTLKRTEVKTSAEIPQVLHYTSTAAVGVEQDQAAVQAG